MLHKFRTYQMAVQVYQLVNRIRAPNYLKDQIMRASSSISLNLAEGSERISPADQRRFYRIAMGSARETQAVLNLLEPTEQTEEAKRLLDTVAASIFTLIKGLDKKIRAN